MGEVIQASGQLYLRVAAMPQKIASGKGSKTIDLTHCVRLGMQVAAYWSETVLNHMLHATHCLEQHSFIKLHNTMAPSHRDSFHKVFRV